MAASLELLGSGCAPSHVPPALVLCFAHTRYLFGAGDGVQRMATEGHVRLAKLGHVFLGSIQHDSIGGITGLLITLADLGAKRVGVHGPGPLRQFLQAARHVSVRSGLTIDACELPSEAKEDTTPVRPCYEDANISVEAVILAEQRVYLPPIRSGQGWHQQGHTHHSHQHQAAAAAVAASSPVVEPVDASIDDTAVAHPSPAADAPAPKKAKFVHDRSHPHAASSAAASSSSAGVASSVAAAAAPPRILSYDCVNPSCESARQAAEWVHSTTPSLASYIVTLAPTPGKFDVGRARALGIPPGPLYAKLKNGEAITIRASEMIGAPGVGGKKKPHPKNPQQKKKGAAATAAAAAAAADPAPPAVEESAPAPSLVDDPVRTFHPSDCVEASIPGPIIAVIECPNAAFMHTLVEHRAFARFQAPASTAHASSSSAAPPSESAPHPHLTLMVHQTPLSLLSHPLYREWVGKFGTRVQHVLTHATSSVPRVVFRGAALNYLKLQWYVNDTIFPAKIPVLYGSVTPDESSSSSSSSTSIEAQIAELYPAPLQVHAGVPLLRFHLLPPQNQGLDRSAQVSEIQYPQDVDANLLEAGIGAEERAKLEQWREAMSRGAKEGRSVQQVAEELKASMDVAEEDAAASSSTPGADADTFPSDLTPAPVSSVTSFSSPSLLRDLAAESTATSPELVFLGTGSAIPSKYRNVTGQFWHPGYESLPATAGAAPSHPVGGFFLDCGEGSYGQLCLRYSAQGGSAFVDDLVADLKAVWVSHIHADHHLGLLTLLAKYKQTWMRRYRQRHGDATQFERMELVAPWDVKASTTTTAVDSSHEVPRLVVVGPRRLFFWLKEYAACAFEVGVEDQIQAFPVAADSAPSSPPPPRTLWDWIEFVGCSELQDRANRLSAFFASNAPAAAQRYPGLVPRSLPVVQTVQVRHCTDAYGLVVETAAGALGSPPYKLVISGDTQPCQALVDAGADATLLVHEATFEDDMEAEAQSKRHATTRQAVQVGLAMRAQRILLTHFSQRYPKLPTASSSRSSSTGLARTCIAFDLMSIRMRDLDWLPSLTPAFAWIFSDEEIARYQNGKEESVTMA